jgi:hypothetical protein
VKKMKMKVFGRTVPAVAIALIAMAALASAGLLSYYGMITGTAKVQQSLVISSDGSTWKECTGGNYSQCKITYDATEITAGDTKDFNQTFYIKNNLPAGGTWDYVNFAYRFTIPENLYDGLTVWKSKWAMNGASPCQEADILSLISSGCSDKKNCSYNWSQDGYQRYLTINKDNSNNIIITITDRLGKGMTQKFCGSTIGLNPATIPGNYTITIEIVPA